MEKEYDLSKVVRMRKVSPLYRFALALLGPYYILKLLIKQMLRKTDQNVMHDGYRENLTGEKLIAFSKILPFDRIKAAAKSMHVTVNEFMTAALSVGLKEYSLQNKDKETC